MVQTMEDGSWSLHLREQSKRTGPLTKIDWERCPDAHCRGLGAKRPPLTSVWSIALEGLAALTASIGLRPGALSADPIDLVLPERA
ncbi:hypothetical protein SAMN04487783_1599 [Agrococcus baldri]|uniref:Uncharacterized protein n=1 Tax=Agrococcus baldri TaxID=153730 RepID=A0AA94KZN0_9MICO|nr:hypothetical protein SAMN04487783_1599 [Agrococcus baldri]